ncbi:MAG: hypothetical protein OFPII_28980 [Osedax symbiont Rs1]|nr:MAG: hypothetical protein OFPII_28980 [Osedax symbiont Rs1]
MGAAKIFQFHCRTNILHSVFTLKSRIQENDYKIKLLSSARLTHWLLIL